MKAHDVFPSAWLSASDLGTARPTVMIERVDWATFTDGTKKRAVYFAGKEKALTVNVTNFNAIAEITGEDDDENWPGHRIRLYATKVDFQGKRVDAIRVEEPAAQQQTVPARRRMPAPPPDPEPDFDRGGSDDLDQSEVPF
jgi:hypothetical protein